MGGGEEEGEGAMGRGEAVGAVPRGCMGSKMAKIARLAIGGHCMEQLLGGSDGQPPSDLGIKGEEGLRSTGHTLYL